MVLKGAAVLSLAALSGCTFAGAFPQTAAAALAPLSSPASQRSVEPRAARFDQDNAPSDVVSGSVSPTPSGSPATHTQLSANSSSYSRPPDMSASDATGSTAHTSESDLLDISSPTDERTTSRSTSTTPTTSAGLFNFLTAFSNPLAPLLSPTSEFLPTTTSPTSSSFSEPRPSPSLSIDLFPSQAHSSVAIGSTSTTQQASSSNGGAWNTTSPDGPVPTTGASAGSTIPGTTAVTGPSGAGQYSATTCQPSDLLRPATAYSIVYTSTITIYGSALVNMTQLYPPISTPAPCIQPGLAVPAVVSAVACNNLLGDLLLGGCDGGSTTPSTPAAEGIGFSLMGMLSAVFRPTILMVTTAQQPTIVYSSTLPSYGEGGSGVQNVRQSAISVTGIVTPAYGQSTTPNSDHGHAVQSDMSSSSSSSMTPAPVTIGIHSSDVVINGNTFVDEPSQPTQTVTVSNNTFTIGPSEVVGAGATVTRPAVTPGGVYALTPTSTQISGITVQVSSSAAVIDGTSYSIGTVPITTVVKGQTVSIGPSGVAVAAYTIPVMVVPTPTQIVVQGGDLVTVIGQSLVVIDGTSINYPSLTASSTTVLDGDTVTLGTGGVTVRSMTFGGPSAGSSATDYEIVGGATVTEIGDSTVVIDGTTATAAPDGTASTTVVANETITIGPGGVIVSTFSFPFPDAYTTTITPAPAVTPGGPGTTTGALGSGKAAKPTTSHKGGAGPGPRPDTAMGFFLSCIAICVLILGY